MTAAHFYYLIVYILVLTFDLCSAVTNGFALFAFYRALSGKKLDGLKGLILLTAADFLYALTILPHVVYVLADWKDEHRLLKYSPSFMVVTALPQVIQLKVCLLMSSYIAADRLLAVHWSSTYQPERHFGRAAIVMCVGVGWGVVDLAIIFTTTSLRKTVPGCPAVGCFFSALYDEYLSIASTLMGVVAILVIVALAIRLHTRSNSDASTFQSTKGFAQANRLSISILISLGTFVLIPSILTGVVVQTPLKIFDKVAPTYLIGLVFSGCSDALVNVTQHREIRQSATNMLGQLFGQTSSSRVTKVCTTAEMPSVSRSFVQRT